MDVLTPSGRVRQTTASTMEIELNIHESDENHWVLWTKAQIYRFVSEFVSTFIQNRKYCTWVTGHNICGRISKRTVDHH